MSYPEEEAFHRTRRMFVLLEKAFWVAPKNDTRSHEEWFLWMGWPDAMDRVRGFYDKRGVFLYQRTRGSKWDVTPEVIETAPRIAWHLKVLKEGIPDHYDDLELGTPLFGGMVPGVIGTLWGPKCRLDILVGGVLVPPDPSKTDRPVYSRSYLPKHQLGGLLRTCICGYCGDLRECPCGRMLRANDTCPACGRPSWCVS